MVGTAWGLPPWILTIPLYANFTPVVVHWLVPLITVKFPDASIFKFALSYFKDIAFDVFKKGFEKVKLFCFEFNKVVEVAFKLLIPNLT